MSIVTGRIAAVQEGRFLLTAENGRALLLTAAHDSGIALRDLERWHRSRERVTVEFRGEPNLASGVAERIRAAGSTSAAA